MCVARNPEQAGANLLSWSSWLVTRVLDANQEDLELLALTESIRRGYLVGSLALGRSLCERKMAQDVSIVTVKFGTDDVIKTVLEAKYQPAVLDEQVKILQGAA